MKFIPPKIHKYDKKDVTRCVHRLGIYCESELVKEYNHNQTMAEGSPFICPRKGTSPIHDNKGANQMSDKDPELVKVIDEAIASEPSYTKALDRVIQWQKENRGLKGIHISVDPFRDRTNLSVHDEAEQLAHETLMIHREGALGLLEEVDLTENPM